MLDSLLRRCYPIEDVTYVSARHHDVLPTSAAGQDGPDRNGQGKEATGVSKVQRQMARRSLWIVAALLLIGGLLGAAPAASRTLAANPSPGPHGDPPLAPGAPVEDPYQRIQPAVIEGLNLTGRANYIVVLTDQADTSNNLTGWAAKGQ